MKKVSVRPGLFVIYGLFLLCLSICKSTEIFLDYLRLLERIAGGDKYLHFYMAMPLGYLLLAGLELHVGRLLVRLSFSLLLLLSLLIMEELSQIWISGRHFDWLDIVFGLVGVAFGTIVYLVEIVIKHWLLGRNDQ